MNETAVPELTARLTAFFGDRLDGVATGADGIVTLEVPVARWREVALDLRDGAVIACRQLTDLCGIDYLSYGQDEWATSDEATSSGFSRGVDAQGPGRFGWDERPAAGDPARRFAVVAHLLSHEHNRRLRMRCYAVDDDLPMIPSLVEVWPGAAWFEREAFDLFGIVFDGHPDLRRILTDYGFIGHPFRKDFPLIGNATVHYDPEQRRVVYGPVEIEPRVLVPKVVRPGSAPAADDERGRR